MSYFKAFFHSLGKKKEIKKPVPTTPTRHIVKDVDSGTNTITLTEALILGTTIQLVDTANWSALSPADYDSGPPSDSTSSSSSSDYSGDGGSFSGGGSSDSY
jgi:uncharacterized membrane protein YgcG